MEIGRLIKLLSQPPSEMANGHIPMLRKQRHKSTTKRIALAQTYLFI